MDARQLVESMSQVSLRSFIAPVTPRTEKILIVQSGVPFAFSRKKHTKHRVGWVRFAKSEAKSRSPDDFVSVSLSSGEVQEWEIETYLEHLKPQFRLIVLYRLGEDTWLCYPWNLSDAVQKGWPLDEPRAVYLTRRSIEPFNFITACGSPDNLIFQGIDVKTESQLDRTHFLESAHNFINSLLSTEQVFRGLTPEMRTSFTIVKAEIQRREQETFRNNAMEQKKTFEGRIKYYLEFLGAKLVRWKEFGNNFEITWGDGILANKHTHTAIIDRRVNTVSAGICLSDRDSDFDLTSLVDVYREKEARDYDDE